MLLNLVLKLGCSVCADKAQSHFYSYSDQLKVSQSINALIHYSNHSLTLRQRWFIAERLLLFHMKASLPLITFEMISVCESSLRLTHQRRGALWRGGWWKKTNPLVKSSSRGCGDCRIMVLTINRLRESVSFPSRGCWWRRSGFDVS